MKIIKILLIFGVIFFSGCQSSTFKINVIGQSNKIVIEHNFDTSFLQKIQNITPGFLVASEKFTKHDFLFFVIYEFKIGLGDGILEKKNTLPEGFPYGFEFKVKLPGKIRKTNADKIENSTAIWQLSAGDTLDLWAKSIKVRYWVLIILGLILVIFKSRRKK